MARGVEPVEGVVLGCRDTLWCGVAMQTLGCGKSRMASGGIQQRIGRAALRRFSPSVTGPVRQASDADRDTWREAALGRLVWCRAEGVRPEQHPHTPTAGTSAKAGEPCVCPWAVRLAC